jgi:hypothetical protein
LFGHGILQIQEAILKTAGFAGGMRRRTRRIRLNLAVLWRDQTTPEIPLSSARLGLKQVTMAA